MIVPGKDDNYPGGSWSMNQSGVSQYMPHTIAGLVIAFIVLMLGWHLLTGSKPRRRR